MDFREETPPVLPVPYLIFELYRDASVFFASTEREHGARTADQARERIQWFSRQLSTKDLVKQLIYKIANFRFASSGTRVAKLY